MRYLLFITLFIFSCKGEPQTLEQFADQFEKIMKDKDEEGLKTHFIRSKKEVKKLLSLIDGELRSRESEDIDKLIEDLLEGQEKVYRNIVDRTPDWSDLKYSKIEQKEVAAVGKDLPNGFRVTELKIHYDDIDKPFSINMPLVDLNSGKWKVVDKPRVRRK